MNLRQLKKLVGGAIVGPPRESSEATRLPCTPLSGMRGVALRSRSWAGMCLPAQNQGNFPSCTMEGWCNIKEALLRARGIAIPRGYQLNGPALHRITQDQYYGGNRASGATDEVAFQVAYDQGLFAPGDRIADCDTLDDEIRGMQYSPLSYCFNADDTWASPGQYGYIRTGGKWLGGHKVVICEIYEDARGNVYEGLQNSWGARWGWSGWGLLHRGSVLKTRSSTGPYYVKEGSKAATHDGWKKWLVRNY